MSVLMETDHCTDCEIKQSFCENAFCTLAPVTDDYIRIDKWLEAKGKNWAWLGAQCGWKSGQMSNWSVRGVPAKWYPTIADVIGESTDWIFGRADPRSHANDHLSPMAIKLAAEFDRITNPASQIDAFAEIIAVSTRANGT